MADIDFTAKQSQSNTEESRAGAMACLNAMRIIQRIENHPDPECSMADWWKDKDAAVTAMLQAAGVQSGFISGFIATLAEYVHMVEFTGAPDPHEWEPEATMTDEEKAAYREEFGKGVEEPMEADHV
jgi:hypothetical protein